MTAIGTTAESIREELVDGLGRKTGPQVSLVSRLSAPLAFLATLRRFLWRLDDVARWRLGRGGRVLAGLGQLVTQLGILLFQFRDPRQRVRELFFQLGKTFAVRTCCRFPQFHGAGTYALPPHGAISTHTRDPPNLPDIRRDFAYLFFWKFLGGALANRMSPLRIKILGLTQVAQFVATAIFLDISPAGRRVPRRLYFS